MFDFLQALPNDQLISGVHYAIRIIAHMRDIRDVKIGYAPKGVAGEGTIADQEVCDLIIEEIQDREGTPIVKLPPLVAERYITHLADLLQNALKKRFQYDDQEGIRLLENLRGSHGNPDLV